MPRSPPTGHSVLQNILPLKKEKPSRSNSAAAAKIMIPGFWKCIMAGLTAVMPDMPSTYEMWLFTTTAAGFITSVIILPNSV